MTVLTDPPEAIRQILFANWSLHGNLDKQHIDFNTGIPAGNRKYPSIEVSPVTVGNTPLTVDWWQQTPYVFVHVWERPRTTEKDALNQAKNRRNRIVNEVYDVLIAAQVKVRDMEWIHPMTEVNSDQYTGLGEDSSDRTESSSSQSSSDFPILHTLIPIQGLRWRNSVLGGVPANR